MAFVHPSVLHTEGVWVAPDPSALPQTCLASTQTQTQTLEDMATLLDMAAPPSACSTEARSEQDAHWQAAAVAVAVTASKGKFLTLCLVVVYMDVCRR